MIVAIKVMTMNTNNGWMTVLKQESNGQWKPVTIQLNNVDFIETENRKIVYYIGDEKYYQITKMQDLQEVLNEENGFVSLDRINLVNLKKVKEYDENLGKVYFKEEKVENRRFATIARLKQKLYSPLIHKVIAKNKGMQRTAAFSKESMDKRSVKLEQDH